MLRPWKIGTFFGVETFVHWSFLLLPIYLLYANRHLGILSAVLLAAVSLVMLFFVLLHEFGHVLAARAFQIPTKSVTLYPIGGVALMTRSAKTPIEEIIIAVAGPVVNLVLAFLLGGIAIPAGIPLMPFDPSAGVHTFSDFFSLLMISNISLLVFNMIPAFPMDGGRVLRAFFWFFTDVVSATRLATYVAIPFAILFAVFGLFANFFFIIIAGLIVIMGRLELHGLQMQLEMKRRQQMEASAATAYENNEATPPERDFDGYTWNAQENGWIEWRSGRPVRIYRMRLW
jgi:Zn-dependent protease